MRILTLRLLALMAVLAVGPSAAAAQVSSPAAPASASPDASADTSATQGPLVTAAVPGGATTTPCGASIPPPAALPPAGSDPVIYQVELCFQAQGNVSTVEPQTYLYYMQFRASQPSQGIWVMHDESAERRMQEDFRRLWATNFLDDLRIEVTEPEKSYRFANGVIGKIVTYYMEERERVKIVNYEGSKDIVDRTKIDEQLRMRGIELRLDSFRDAGVIRRIETVLREMAAEKGFTNAVVKHTVTSVAGGPKLVNITFNVSEGPKIKIRDVEFVGNEAKSDRALRRKLKENKPRGLLGFITGGGTYQEAKFEADADLVQSYYRNEGYVRVR
ncbi:MAG: POTRA domain-containing protein, partial [Vicinamibacterales bacterium]